jgi:hypothetical protein
MVARQVAILAARLVARQETPSLPDLNLVPSTDLNCSNLCSFLFQTSINTSSTCSYCLIIEILIPCAHFFCKTCLTQLTLHPQTLQLSPWSTQH